MPITTTTGYLVSCDLCGISAAPAFDTTIAQNNAASAGFAMITTNAPQVQQKWLCQNCKSLVTNAVVVGS